MSDLSDAFLAKAQESLAGAASEFGNARYNNAANRAYYGAFQAAVAALDLAGVRPAGGTNDWGHAFVQARFAGLLVRQRKLYPAELRDTLQQLAALRVVGDYRDTPVSANQAGRALSRARALAAVAARGGTTA